MIVRSDFGKEGEMKSYFIYHTTMVETVQDFFVRDVHKTAYRKIASSNTSRLEAHGGSDRMQF